VVNGWDGRRPWRPGCARAIGAAYTEFPSGCKRRAPRAKLAAYREGTQKMTLPITLTIAAAAALINIWLGSRVSRLRLRHKVSIGDGGDERVACRMRAHSNFVEYTPFFLILLGLVELSQGSEQWLWWVSILFILARLAHPFGMERPAPNALRAGGMVVSWLVLIGLAGYALAIPYLERPEQPTITYAATPLR
jgi:uncharacterized protein